MIRYGKVIESIQEGNITTISTVAIHDYEEKVRHTAYIERFSVHDDKDILTEFLKMMDKYKRGDMREPGFKIIEKKNKPHFVDVNWSE